MKKFLLSSIFLFSLAYGVIACTEGLPTDNWEEPVVPVDPAVTTLRGSFESKFVRYSKGQQHEVQSPNQKIPDRKTKCVIKTHINIKQNVIFGAKLKPV